jgi:serine/threonine protein kinase
MPGQRITDFRPDLPQEADLFLIKALARDPDERFGSAREFHDTLLHVYRLYKAREEGKPPPPSPLPAGSPGNAKRPGILDRARAFLRRLFHCKGG